VPSNVFADGLAVEQPVAREIRMEHEPDEAALEPVVNREWECGRDVRVDSRPISTVEHIEQPARVVDEAAAVRQLADVIDPRPAGRRDILVGRAHAARIRQPHDVANVDGDPPLDDRRRNRIARNWPVLRVERSSGTERGGD
jgi:hypothetical protein